MSDEKTLTAAAAAIDAAGIDTGSWGGALSAIAHLFDAEFATLETFDRKTRGHLEFRASSLPPGSMAAYLHHYAPLCPRTRYIWARPEKQVVHDHLVMDDGEMDRHPYYQEFLASEGLRYFMSGLVKRTGTDQTLITVQRSGRAGHVSEAETRAITALLPRLRNSLDLTRRLPKLDAGLRNALDWLRDGAAVISRDEKLVYFNPAMEEMFSKSDGLRMSSGTLALDDATAMAALAKTLSALQRQRMSPLSLVKAADILVTRPSGARPYLLSIRALPSSATDTLFLATDPLAVVFARDTEAPTSAVMPAIRQAFGLTRAEAQLAGALRAGIAPHDYAQAQGLSHHTVYTHLRRLREKFGVQSVGALVRLLADLDPPVRGG
jgi:DNA-binding CsgD family transcriptional regulator/PAS domain-containing protein